MTRAVKRPRVETSRKPEPGNFSWSASRNAEVETSSRPRLTGTSLGVESSTVPSGRIPDVPTNAASTRTWRRADSVSVPTSDW